MTTIIVMLILVILVALIFIGIYVFKSYNELTAIHELISKNVLFE